MSTLILLRQAVAAGRLRDLDLHFALHLAAVSGDGSDPLLLAAALASQRTGEGHVCVALDEVAGMELFADGEGHGPSAPALGDWRAALRASPAVGRPGEFAPLVLDAADRLYLGRYFHFEETVGRVLGQLAYDASGTDLAWLRGGLDRHFPGRRPEDRQPLAAAVALLRRLAVIAGGPGTGKTTTVARILALLVEQAAPRRPRIALAAPTGKAAARLTESLRHHLATLPPEVAAALPSEASTLHRLLGALPDATGFRHHAGNPLHLEALVVDEVSMVDLPLMARLLDALPANARLILLGDPDQLASVEAGSVLGDLCGEESQGFTAAMAARFDGLGIDVGNAPSAGVPLADSLVFLTASHRFGDDSGIGNIARAVNRGDADDALAICRDTRFPDARWREVAARDLPERIGERALAAWREYLKCEEPAAVLAAFGRFRFLCAMREGPFGVAEINKLVEQALRRRRLIHGGERHYAGRPIIVTRNDYNVRLFNGDIGMVLPDPGAGNRLRAIFPEPGGGLRRVLLNRLPEHETVFAMTIHKSQGSEFESCVLVLPDADNPILTRELLYTGITRARRTVEIWGDTARLPALVARRISRASGLRERLWGGDG